MTGFCTHSAGAHIGYEVKFPDEAWEKSRLVPVGASGPVLHAVVLLLVDLEQYHPHSAWLLFLIWKIGGYPLSYEAWEKKTGADINLNFIDQFLAGRRTHLDLRMY